MIDNHCKVRFKNDLSINSNFLHRFDFASSYIYYENKNSMSEKNELIMNKILIV